MQKQKLAYLCVNNSWGGLEMNQLRNAKWMKERGHEVLLLVLKNSRIANEAIKENLPIIYLKQHKKYYDFKNAWRLKSVIKKNKVTHLILRDPQDISLAVTTKRLLRNKLFVAYFMEMQLGIKKKDFIHTWRFKGLDLWSCPLKFLADQVKTMTNFSPEKIKIIPSGLDLTKFKDLPDSLEARKKLNLPTDKTLLGLIGRFDPQKGHLLLLDAYKKLDDKEKSSIDLVFLGEKMNPDIDNYYEKLQKSIKADNLSSKVHILPFRKDVETFFTAIDVFIMASKAETFGMVTIESMACGTPVIGSNAGGTPELLEFGEKGQLFETLNAESLKSAIERFLKEKKIPKKELQQSVEKFSHKRVCELVEKALK